MPGWFAELPGEWILFALEFVWVVGAALWIVLEKRSPTATLAWIFGLALLPVVGIVVYLWLGPRRLDRKKSRLLKARVTVGHTTEEIADAHKLPDAEPLMRLATRLDGMPPMHAHSVRVFGEGDEVYDAIEAAIRAAKHHVHLEYYIFRDDAAGQRLIAALVDRAKAGVEVRLCFDAVGSSISRASMRAMRAAGVRLAPFNPAFSGRLGQRIFNFRTHRKIVVVDGRVGFTGGVNVTDDHSAKARGKQAWRDTHLEVVGEAVQGLQRTFLENWTFASGEKKTGAELDPYFPPGEEAPHLVQIVASGPDDNARAIEALYLAAIGTARRRVWLTTPYFVPNESLLSAICLAGLRGVDVQLVLPTKTDSKMVDLASASFHDPLLRAGVRIHLYLPRMLHAKTAVIDDLGIVGTANLDDRSLKLNFEVIAACYGGPVVQRLSELFEADKEKCRLKMRLEDKAPLHRRFAQSFARLLAPQL
ncbi:MAG: cardiolipin synthase [Myxococcota bacterium]